MFVVCFFFFADHLNSKLKLLKVNEYKQCLLKNLVVTVNGKFTSSPSPCRNSDVFITFSASNLNTQTPAGTQRWGLQQRVDSVTWSR